MGPRRRRSARLSAALASIVRSSLFDFKMPGFYQIDAGDAHQALDVRQFLECSRWVVLHREYLHRRQYLGPRHEDAAAQLHGPLPCFLKDSQGCSGIDVDEIDAPKAGERVEVDAP